MFIHVIKETENELKIEIEGEGHTFCNALQKVLLEDDKIDFAGYDIPHPLVSNPVVYVRTKENRKPETAIRDAVKKLLNRSLEFKRAFEEVL